PGVLAEIGALAEPGDDETGAAEVLDVAGRSGGGAEGALRPKDEDRPLLGRLRDVDQRLPDRRRRREARLGLQALRLRLAVVGARRRERQREGDAEGEAERADPDH